MSTAETANYIRSPILEFIFYTVMILGIGTVNIMLRILISFKFPTDLVTFVDLCSTANISCIFFTGPQHGYYIHGYNPTGQSDGSMKDLINSLKDN